MLHLILMLNTMKIQIKKILSLKLVIVLEFQNIKNIFAKGYTPNWLEEVFIVSKIKNTVPWTYVISDLMVKKLLEVFTKKNCKKIIKKNLE